ncbi:hypothetical protein [Arenivirga flava]|uniref:Uncharacterized protein n=1 Tax=Arenivirga flava TaxID=1930060 RepID=A0AA37UG97_9MICO|nr:hypothetical protein [Arenivirga flava]GMA28283.1 hypothetical protein GCM10025874_15360 [Arenivirga flava]
MGAWLLGNFGVAMLLRVPIGFALVAASFVALVLVTDVPLTIGPQRIIAGITPSRCSRSRCSSWPVRS